jgi:hypothetical protein
MTEAARRIKSVSTGSFFSSSFPDAGQLTLLKRQRSVRLPSIDRVIFRSFARFLGSLFS